MFRTKLAAVLAALTIIGIVSVPGGPAGAAVAVDGAGSTWSSIAVSQWATDVARNGLSINFTPNGSTTGRKWYLEDTTDFAVSEIPFQGPTRDREGNIVDDELERARQRPFAYLPIVAGGTSFMYNLTLNGKRVTDLRLSGETIAKVFTGKITNWNDPAVTRDNGGRAFPSKTIRPFVRSDGSGTSAQFSLWLSTMYPSLWQPFCKAEGVSPCGQTSLWPIFSGAQGQSGSDGVSGAVAQPYNEGAITYVEYGYALLKNIPVASVQNGAGYFVQPTAGNVAVALTKATINPDRTQVLTGVYTNPDKRAYPVSSYSYMIVPTSEAGRFTKEKGAVLGAFISYFLCLGQQKAKRLGYSPLPRNLVEFGFDAMRQIPGAPEPPPLTEKDCPNPSIDISKVPPPPPDAAPDATPGGGTGGPGGRVGGSGATTTTVVVGGDDKTANGTGADDGTGTAVDPNSVEEIAGQNVSSVAPATITASDDQVPNAVYVLVGLLVLAVVFGPPSLSLFLRRRGGG